MPPPTVTLLASLDPLLRERAVATARARDRDLVVVRHELTTPGLDGLVHRRIEQPSGSDEICFAVDDGCCLSCLLSDDTAQLLADLAGRRVLLVFPSSVEPANIALRLNDDKVASVAAIAVAVDVLQLEARLFASEPLSDISDLGADRRISEVLTRQLDHADTVLHDGGDERALALLAALMGDGRHGHVDDPRWLDAAGHDHDQFVARLQPGVPSCRGEVAGHGVEQRCWHRRRPLHPQRLLEALERGPLDGLVRASGWLWVATRPGTVLRLDAVGGSYELGAVDAWLDAIEDPGAVHPARRDSAERHWDAYYGDRGQHLVLTTVDRDLDEIVALLDACLLTDTELAEGSGRWRGWPDPMSPWLGDEADLLRTTTENRE